MTIGKRRYTANARLKKAREERGWYQADLVEKIRESMAASGLSASTLNTKTISKWETGERRPGPTYRVHLAKVFGKSASELGLLSDMPEDETPSDASSVQLEPSTTQAPPPSYFQGGSTFGNRVIETHLDDEYPFISWGSVFVDSIDISADFIWNSILRAWSSDDPPEDLDAPWTQVLTTPDRILMYLTQLSEVAQLPKIAAWLDERPTSEKARTWTLMFAHLTRNRMPELFSDIDLSLLRSVGHQLAGRWEEYDFLSELSSRPLGNDLINRFRHWYYAPHPEDCVYFFATSGEPAFRFDCFLDIEAYSLCNLHQLLMVSRELGAIVTKIQRERQIADGVWSKQQGYQTPEEYIEANEEELTKCAEHRQRYAGSTTDSAFKIN